MSCVRVTSAVIFGSALLTLSVASYADSMSALIAQKSSQVGNTYGYSATTVPTARVSNRAVIRRASHGDSYTQTSSYPAPQFNGSVRAYPQSTYQYPQILSSPPRVLPEFLGGSYDNVDSEYLPLLSLAETQSSLAAREVISTARKMALNERTIIQGGCWDYLNAVFKRAGATRDTVHKGTYGAGPYAQSSEIQAGDWLYYINHSYNRVEHSGLFVGWVDESAKQALILSYAGESRREPARYKVYDLSNVYQIMRPMI